MKYKNKKFYREIDNEKYIIHDAKYLCESKKPNL